MRRIFGLVLVVLLLAAPAFAASVTLVWDSVAGATGYDIEQTLDMTEVLLVAQLSAAVTVLIFRSRARVGTFFATARPTTFLASRRM